MRRVKAASNPAGYSKTPTHEGWRLTRHYVETRALVQFGPDDPVWAHIAKGRPPSLPSDLKDCIAKITPPAGMSESDVLTLENKLFSLGARAVRRMPSPPEDLVVVADSKAKPAANRTLLQVAVERAKRTTSVDTAALVELVELAMSKSD